MATKKPKKDKWGKEYLAPLSIKQYGRSYEDKLNNAVKQMGGDEIDAKGFQRWMDYKTHREDKQLEIAHQQTNTWNKLHKESLQEQEEKRKREKEEEERKRKAQERREADRQRKTTGLASDFGAAFKAARQFFNPFDGISGKEAVQDYLNRGNSKRFEELSRGTSRFIDSTSLGAMSNLDKRINDRQPHYTTQRKMGEGGGTDMLTTGLGYLVPGVGAYKALNATKAGAGLTRMGSQGVKQRLTSEAAKGSITGAGMAAGEVGIREGLNPDDYNAKQNAAFLAMGTAAGAIADPLFYGAGKAIGKGFEKAAGRTMQNLLPSNETAAKALADELEGVSRLKPTEYTMPDGRTVRVKNNADRMIKAKNEEIKVESEAYNKEFEDAVEQQYQYLKNSMGKGVSGGTTSNGLAGNAREVTGKYSVSNNPKWYQDFYAQNGRKPNNQELRELAEVHVKEGFEDEVGDLPAWQPSKVQEIDNEIDEIVTMIRQQPEQEPALRPILEALEQDRAAALKSIDQVKNGEPVTLKPKQETAAAYEAIDPQDKMKFATGPLKKVAEPKAPVKPANIDNPKELVKKQIDTKGKRGKSKWSVDKFMTAMVDDLRPLDKASKSLGGKDMSFEKNPYTQARLARGVAGKAETFLKGGVYTPDGKKVGSSLQEILKPIEKNMDDFLAYVTSKRAVDYDEKGLTAGIKPKDVEGISDRQLAEAAIKQIEKEMPGFKENQKQLVKYSQNLLKELKESGYYTDESLERIFKENPNYVPMQRVQEPKVRGFQPLPKNKYASLADPLKKRTGSEKPIINPVESIVKNTYIINNIAERNKVGVSLLELLENAPEDNMWGRVLKTSKQDDSLDNLSGVLDEASAQMDSNGEAPAIDQLFKGEGNKVYVYRNGEKVEMELQEDLYKAMLALDTQKQNFFIKMLSVPTRMLRTGAVLSPDFGPVNIFRDQFSAFVNSKYGFIPFVDMFSGMKNVLKKDDTYWSWKNAGGANSVLSSLDREYLQADLRSMVKQSLWENVKQRGKSPLQTMLEPLRIASEITEEATRLGEYKKGIKKGASPKEAAFASRDLIDFSRAGNIGRQYNQVTAFFNAAVQSIDKLGRTFKENPFKASAKAATAITLPSVVAYYYNHDKEWYKEIPQRERDLYWHFEIDDQIYKLPKPFEAGILFGTSAERMMDYMKTNDPESFKGFGEAVVQAFTPSWVPTAVLPWIEVYANKSMHFDSPIVPRREQDMLPEDQYGPYQSELAKTFGSFSKISPRKVDHVIKGYTGGLGKYALNGTDYAATATGYSQRPQLPDRGLADKPIVNRFVVKNLEGNNQSVDDFYTRLDQLTRESRSAKKRNPDRENTYEYKEMNKISREISDLQGEKREILEDMNMSGKEKADKIKELDKFITQLAKKGNDLQNWAK